MKKEISSPKHKISEPVELLDPNFYSGLSCRPVNVLTERESYQKLLNRCFTSEQSQDYLRDFPVWGVTDSTNQAIGLYNDKGRLIASSAARIALLKVGVRRIKVGLIGAVSTDPEFRGKGLAGKLLEANLEWLKANRVPAAFLWGSQTDLYQRHGFHLAGTQFRTSLQNLKLSTDPNLVVRHGWNPNLMPLIRRRGQGLVISERDMQWYSKHENVRFLWVGSNENPQAFVAVDRGIDLQGIVHEWGGQTETIMALLGHLRQIRPDAQIISSRELLHYLPIKDEDQLISEYLTMVHVLDPELLIREALPKLNFSADRVQGRWDIKLNSFDLKGVQDEEIARMIFGPLGDVEDAVAPLPIPIWFWGLDSA